MAISTYSLDPFYNDLADQCTDVCNSGSTNIYGIEWIEGIDQDNDQNEDGEESDYSDGDADADSEKEEDNRVLVWGEAAPSLSAG